MLGQERLLLSTLQLQPAALSHPLKTHHLVVHPHEMHGISEVTLKVPDWHSGRTSTSMLAGLGFNPRSGHT